MSVSIITQKFRPLVSVGSHPYIPHMKETPFFQKKIQEQVNENVQMTRHVF